MSSDFVFWGKNWAWANFSKEFKVTAPYEYSIVGKNQALNFAITARYQGIESATGLGI